METTALVPTEPRANGVTPLATPPVRIETQSMDLMTLAQALAKSGYFKDATDASKAVVKVLYGQELGVPPVTAMMSIHIIEGKPAPSANLLASLVKRSGHYNYRVVEHNGEACEIAFFEGGQEIGRSRWTRKDAEAAGLWGKNTWAKYPRQMLFSRALSEGVRTHLPHLFGGAPVYTPEELGAQVNADGEVITVNTQTGEVTDPPARARTRAAVQGAEQGTYAENAADLSSVPALRQACAEQLKRNGYPDPTKPKEHFEAILGRPIARLSELTLLDWRLLHDGLKLANDRSRRGYALWSDLCKEPGFDIRDPKDREARLQAWGELVGSHLETSGVLTADQWEMLNLRLQYKLDTLRQEAQEQAAAQAQSQPEAGATPSDTPYSSGQGDPFADQ